MSRAVPPLADTRRLASAIAATPEVALLETLCPLLNAINAEDLGIILNEAAKFAAEYLTPLNAIEQSNPPVVRDGKVRVPEKMKIFWQAMIESGWLSIDLPEEYGGQGLPAYVALAVQEIFDRSCSATSMLPTPNRSAVLLLNAFGSETLKNEWIPALTTGERLASICISETGAGSDVNRMSTKACPAGDGIWEITGEKQWISFGDHDLTDHIGHCCLARAQGDKALSLFFIPNQWDGAANNIRVRRIEEKLGLHLSPTCALGFEGAKGWLLGEQGRGLPQMFVMISNMRLFVGNQGLGLASASADIALAYAKERRQGGHGPDPLQIIEHADVQRQLLEITSRVESLRALGMGLACHVNLAKASTDAARREASAHLVGWLTPIFKTIGGEAAFECASNAVQILGGAGYTQDWPIEQYLRDARVLPVFEGATGIQALDILHRRLWGRDEGQGLNIFLKIARSEIDELPETLQAGVRAAYEKLELAGEKLKILKAESVKGEAAATAFLHMAGCAAYIWGAVRLVKANATEDISPVTYQSALYLVKRAECDMAACYSVFEGDLAVSEMMSTAKNF